MYAKQELVVSAPGEGCGCMSQYSKPNIFFASILFDYGFNNFENKRIITAGKALDNNIGVSGGKTAYVKGEYKDDFYYICNKTEKANIVTEIKLNDNIKAPIKSGEKLGVVYVAIDGRVIGEIDIVASFDVAKLTIIDNINRIKDNFFI